MKKRILVVIIMLTLNLSITAKAGVPVLSPTELIQAILEYTQTLKDYEEQMTQVSQGYQQIAQLEKEYAQALREYDHLLEQAQAYKDKWGSHDWNKFIDEMADYYAKKNYKSNSELEQDNDYWKNKTLYVSKYGKVISWGQVKSQLESLNFKNGNEYLTDLETDYTQINSGVNKIGTVTQINKYVNDKIDFLEKMEEERLGLGENSELATLQYLLKQNEEMMKIQLQKMVFDSELIRIADEKQNIQNNKEMNRQYQELLQIKESLNKPLTYDNSRARLGNF